ncbi:MAG: adenylate/guanylate cyclase domain-containing protein [Syntrophorhabdaceae bacterium]|nr:adenylate/guanylate cyclase domain-containing protein [Syntrophorhabdaceae bacterium]
MRKKIIPISIGILISIIFSIFAVIKPLPLEHLEQLIYDTRYKVRGRGTPPPEIVIAAIDDRSLEKIGRWPWERARIAQVIDRLVAMGAKVIMVDIIFSEPARDDGVLASSIKSAGNVILPIVFDFKGEKKKITEEFLYDNVFPIVRNSDYFKIFPPLSAHSALLPVKELINATKTLGYINMFPDKDGVLRWEVLTVEFDGEIFPSIDLQTARMYMGLPIESMILRATQGIQLGDKFIPTDFWGRALIHYYGPEGTFPYISIVDILDGRVNPSTIKDKIVLIGATAVGIYDLRVTPTSAAMPGIEKHASVIASILRQDFIYKITNLTNILIILISGIIFTILIVQLKAIFGAIFALLFIGALSLMSYYFFFWKNLWITLSYSTINILITYFFITAYRYATEERYAKRIRGMFSSYVTEKVVNELIKNPNLAKLGGERKEVTVLFSDIRGFTTFSEKHGPEEVVKILNEYLGEMTNIIFKWDGTLDKFVGDEIVAFWNAPIPQENHAELAVKCALHMVRRLKELQQKWISEGKTPLDAGYGINTGEVIVGNIGAEGKKMDYTVIGDNVNLGARVEGLTRKYNTNIIITESTFEKIKDKILDGTIWHIRVKGLDKVAVKGKTKPVEIYEVVEVAKDQPSEIIELEEKEVVTFTEK